MRVLLVALLIACGSNTPDSRSDPPASAPVRCGAATCAANEICVPGGASRNGIGETIQLPPEHCAPLPAACHGIAACSCVTSLCRIGGCASVENGRLVCLAG